MKHRLHQLWPKNTPNLKELNRFEHPKQNWIYHFLPSRAQWNKQYTSASPDVTLDIKDLWLTLEEVTFYQL